MQETLLILLLELQQDYKLQLPEMILFVFKVAVQVIMDTWKLQPLMMQGNQFMYVNIQEYSQILEEHLLFLMVVEILLFLEDWVLIDHHHLHINWISVDREDLATLFLYRII